MKYIKLNSAHIIQKTEQLGLQRVPELPMPVTVDRPTLPKEFILLAKIREKKKSFNETYNSMVVTHPNAILPERLFSRIHQLRTQDRVRGSVEADACIDGRQLPIARWK
jgi:hypothetical protein